MTPDELSALLISLGSTPDEVAETLRREGCPGIPQSGGECPVARFLRRKTGKPFDVGADTACNGYAGPWGELPLPVRLFVDRFDKRRYPDLIEARPL